MSDELVLETDRLVLRPMTAADADEWWRTIGSDAEVTRFLPTGRPIPLSEMPGRMHRVAGHWRKHGFGICSVRGKEEGSLIGHCGLIVNEPPDVELVYALARSAWGHGLATEAARSMVTFGFEERGLHRLFALVVPENTGSVHVLEKLGFSMWDEVTREGDELLRYVRENEDVSAS